MCRIALSHLPAYLRPCNIWFSEPWFTSKFFREVSKFLGVKQCLSSSRHPQSDGQTERANRTLEDMLRHFVRPAQDDWDIKLPCF